MCLSSSRLEFNDDDVDEEDDDDDDGELDADDGRRCSVAGPGVSTGTAINDCRNTGLARLVTVPFAGSLTYVLMGGHNIAASVSSSSFSDCGILITSGKSAIAAGCSCDSSVLPPLPMPSPPPTPVPDPGTTFSGITNPLSLDMLRRRCSIRAFSDDRPISAYAFIVLKYLLYGCSMRL